MTQETFLKPRLKAIARQYEDWFKNWSDIQVLSIDFNKCLFKLNVKNNMFSIQLIEENNKILVISDSLRRNRKQKLRNFLAWVYLFNLCYF